MKFATSASGRSVAIAADVMIYGEPVREKGRSFTSMRADCHHKVDTIFTKAGRAFTLWEKIKRGEIAAHLVPLIQRDNAKAFRSFQRQETKLAKKS